MKESKLDPIFSAALLATGLILLVGLVLVFLSLLSPFVYIFAAIMLPLCLGAFAEMRGIF